MKRGLCLSGVILWVLGLAAAGWLLVNDRTAKGSDGRREILLAPVEREQILAEMLRRLKAVDGIVRGLGEARDGTRK